MKYLLLTALGLCGTAYGQVDTIQCTMLVCDTMHYTNYTPSVSQQNYFDKSGAAFWVIGYEVREKETDYMMQGSDGEPYIRYKHLVYLDADKKPLSKNIIVWMCK